MNRRTVSLCIFALLAVVLEGGLARAEKTEKADRQPLTTRVASAVRKAPGQAWRGTKNGLRWVKAHPKESVTIAAGTAGMFATGLYVSPELAHHVRDLAEPSVGHAAATMLGTASGGALASGARSLLIHATPMITRVDPFNPKQLAVDVGMSTVFNFPGFAVAEGLNMATGGMNPVARGGTLLTGLVGWEMVKDYMQMNIRSRFATVPKRFKDVWKEMLVMEIASNWHRVFFPTSFVAKQAGDVAGVAAYDRIVNNVFFGDKQANKAARAKKEAAKIALEE